MQQQEEEPLVKNKQNIVEVFGEFKAARVKCRRTAVAKHLHSLRSVADAV